MSENLDTNLPEGSSNLEQKQEPQTPEYSEIEQRALEMGWRPKEEFNGDEADFIDAGEFVRRKPLFDKIENSSREVKQLRKAFDALKQHYTTVKDAEYNRALTALKNARREALSAGDGDRFETIDDEIKRVEVEAAQIQSVGVVEEAPQVHPEFAAWTNRNPWYTSEKHMKVFADELGNKLGARGMTPREVLAEVEKAVKAEFPHKFRNSNKDSAPDVDSSAPRGSKRDTFVLSEQEERVMNTLIRSDPKTFTREKYIAELKAAKGIK